MLGQRVGDPLSLLHPSPNGSDSDAAAWIPYSLSSYSTSGRLSNLGFATSSLPACANSKFQRQKSHWGTQRAIKATKSYRPISLLCVPFKILERLIYARVDPIIDPLLPWEQAGFRHGTSAVDQATLLTQGIEDSVSAKKKARAVCRPHSSLQHCMAPRPHLQDAAIAAW